MEHHTKFDEQTSQPKPQNSHDKSQLEDGVVTENWLSSLPSLVL